MTNDARFLKKKKIWRPEFGPTGPKSGLKLVFFSFSQFWLICSLYFLEIAYNDSLQQCIICSRGKTNEKNSGEQIWAKRGENEAQN